MYFSDSYELRQLEKLMRSIPNFRPRGHGVVILRRYEYTEKDCDCRACPHHISRKKGSSDSTDQLHSFAAQIRYYSDYTKKHPESSGATDCDNRRVREDMVFNR